MTADFSLKVICSEGLTGLELGDEIKLSPLLELRQPSRWHVWNRLGPANGTVELTGGPVIFSSSIIDLGEEKEKKRYRVQTTMTVPSEDARQPAEKRCFRAPGTGEKVVGTWIAEGGG